MGAGEGSTSRKKVGKISIKNSKIVVQEEGSDSTSSEGEQSEDSEDELSGEEEDENDPEWLGTSDEVEVRVEISDDENEDEDDEHEASSNSPSEDLDEGNDTKSALDVAWTEIADVLDGTKYDLEMDANQVAAPKNTRKSTPRSAKAMGKMKALDVERLTAALKNLKKATYGTVNDIDAEKQRKLDHSKARNQAQVTVAAEYTTDKEHYDDMVKAEAQNLTDKFQFFFKWPARATARAEVLVSRNVIKYLEPEPVKKEAEAKVVTETNRIARELELKYLDRTMMAQVSARTIKAAGKLADEKGFAGKLKRARETCRVKVAARFVTDMEAYKKEIEDDCRLAPVESEEDEETRQKILPSERKRVEIKHALEIIKGLDQDKKLTALEEIDNLALALVKERAAKKKPAPRYLMDKYKTGSADGSFEAGGSNSTCAASPGNQAEAGDRLDEADATGPSGVGAAEPSDSLEGKRVRIERHAGQKRKRDQPLRSPVMTRSKTKGAEAAAAASTA